MVPSARAQRAVRRVRFVTRDDGTEMLERVAMAAEDIAVDLSCRRSPMHTQALESAASRAASGDRRRRRQDPASTRRRNRRSVIRRTRGAGASRPRRSDGSCEPRQAASSAATHTPRENPAARTRRDRQAWHRDARSCRRQCQRLLQQLSCRFLRGGRRINQHHGDPAESVAVADRRRPCRRRRRFRWSPRGSHPGSR